MYALDKAPMPLAHLSVPPGLVLPSQPQSPNPLDSSKKSLLGLPFDDDSMYNNEILRLENIFNSLLLKRSEIETNLNEIYKRISELKRKKEMIKNFSVDSLFGGGGVSPLPQTTSFPPNFIPQVNHIAVPETVPETVDVNHLPELNSDFINTVLNILTINPGLLANQIKSKIPYEIIPPGRYSFQQILLKIPGVIFKVEKITSKRSGKELYDNVFYIDKSSTKVIPEPRVRKESKKICFQKQRGKACKVNNEGICSFCN